VWHCNQEQHKVNKACFLLAGISVCFINSVNAAQSIGSPYEGGLFLYQQPVERYKNDWVAFPLMPRNKIPTTDQADVQIKGEGKTVDFSGNLSINCGTGKYSWKSASNFGKTLSQPAEVSEVVPTQALKNAQSLFCRK
jgi:hypothetical protein